MDGTVFVGSSLKYAREDHRHPIDTSRAAVSHNHSAANITSGTLAVARGGTGITTNPSMLTNLGSTTAASVFATSPRPGVTGTLPIVRGGTGATTAAAALANLGGISIASGSTIRSNDILQYINNSWKPTSFKSAFENSIYTFSSQLAICHCSCYSGTGKVGASNSINLAFDFKPWLMVLFHQTDGCAKIYQTNGNFWIGCT